MLPVAYALESIYHVLHERGLSGNCAAATLAFTTLYKQSIHMSKKLKKATPASAGSQPKREGNGIDPKPAITQASTVATLKDLRKVTQHTQDDLALAMGVGQGTVSRIEKRHDMLVSTLQHYVEGVGGKLQILATFPNRPPLLVERLGKKAATSSSKDTNKKPVGSSSQAVP